MFSTDVITRLLRKFESRLEDCLQCCACLDGITAVLEFAVAEAGRLGAGLAEEELRARAGAARAFAVRGSLQALQPWENIHV
jgi:hypothetical protein